MIYAENSTCLSEAATKFVGIAPYRGPKPKWGQSIQIKRYARCSDGRIYALLTIQGPRVAKVWADVVTGTLYRPKDGACWSSVKALDVGHMQTVQEQEVIDWTTGAKERSKRKDLVETEE